MQSLRPLALTALLLACDIYDSTLVEGGGGEGGDGGASGPSAGGTGGGTGAMGPGPGGSGGGPACETPADCPGIDTECGSRTCEGGVCGVDAVPAGTPTAEQNDGDCQENVCDGAGAIVTEADDADTQDDQNDCTDDTCVDGAPNHTPVGKFELCDGGGMICTGEGVCVECIDDIDCSGTDICTPQNQCVPAACDDGMLNGLETDIDCGGPTCAGCAFGDDCDDDDDCLSDNCVAGTCDGSCIDGMQNQDESDVDCGGVCSPCLVGDTCDLDSDCASGNCGTTTCGEYQLLLSEAREGGPNGGTDDYIEIYNPLSVSVTLPTDFQVTTRGTGGSYTVKFTGSGQVMDPGDHLLIAGGGYLGTADQKEPAGMGLVPDKFSIVLRRGGNVIDAGCFHYGASPFGGAGYICEGAPLVFVGTNQDRGFEREPGGAAGNDLDTGDTATDFTQIMPGNPQHLGSTPTP